MSLKFLSGQGIDGNVGIGTNIPDAKLEVNVASGDGILIKSADVATFKMKGGGNANWGFATTNLASGDFGIYKSNASGGDPISAGTPQLYIKSSGNVGIGTDNPDSKLHVLQSGNGTSSLIITEDNARKIKIGRDSIQCTNLSDSAANLYLNQAGGTVSIPTASLAIGATSPLGGLRVNGGTGDTVSQEPTISLTRTSSTGNVLVGKMIVTTKPSDTTNHGNLVFQVKTTASSGESSAYYTNAITIDGNSANVGIGTDSPGEKLEITGNSITRSKTRGLGTNYATSEGWVASSGVSSAIGFFGGNFSSNGGDAENKIEYDIGPFESRELVWMSIPETASNSDGGWNKSMDGFNNSANNGFMSVIYVRRDSGTASGSFYHGCSGSSTLNLSGSANTNPYYTNTGIGNLPANVWCVAIGIIHAANDTTTTSSTLSGLYRLDTGQKIQGAGTFRQKTSNAAQIQRVYHYYSTSPTAQLDFANPGFYILDGSEPTLGELLGSGSADDVFWSANGNDIYNDNSGKVFINATASIPSRTEEFQVTGTQIITNTGTNSPSLYLGYNSSGSTTVQLGRGRTADGLSYIDLNGEVMAAGDYGFRIMRRSGVNAITDLIQVGTGNLTINALNGADTVFTNTNVGIGTTSPDTVNKLQVNGQTRVVGKFMAGDAGASNTALQQIHVKNSGTAGIRLEDSDNGNLAFDLIVDEGTGFYISETIGGDPGDDVRFLIEETTGNVGIGTTSPSTKLHVSSSENANWTTTVQNTLNSNSHSVYTGYNNGSTNARYGVYIQGAGTTANDYHLLINSQFAVLGNGNVGIGMTSPKSKLHVDGNVQMENGGMLSFYSGAGANAENIGIKGTDATGTLTFHTEAVERMRIDNTGNVGIGTTSPQSTRKLDVAGHIQGSQNLYLGVAGTNSSTNSVEIGQGRTGNGFAYMDLTGDATYSDYGLRIIRNNTGANASSQIVHRGTGSFSITTTESADILLIGGNVGINDTAPDTKLVVVDVTKDLTQSTTETGQGTVSLVSSDNQAADKGASLLFGGRYVTGNATTTAFAAITGRKENSTTNNNAAYLAFYTAKPGLGNVMNERMRINSDGALKLNNYTSTSYKSGVTPINPIQSFYPSNGVGSDTTTDLAVDQQGNVVRTTQEATWKLTRTQVDALTTSTAGTTLLSAPGSSNLFIIIEKVTFLIEFVYNNNQMSTSQQYQIIQDGNIADEIALINGTRINNIAYSGGSTNTSGIYEHDTGYSTLNRTYKPNTATTIRRVNTGALNTAVSTMSIKIRYRVYDKTTF